MEYNIDDLFTQMDNLIVTNEKEKGQELAKMPRDYCAKCEKQMFKDESNGIIVCTSCGCVSEISIIDDGAEWSFGFSDDNQFQKDPSRCGAPINPFFEKSSMSTMIQGGNKRSLMQRIHTQMSMDYVERARWHIFEHINKIAVDRGNLNQVVVNQAKTYYIKLSKRKLSRGNIRKGLIAVCILNACKACNVNRSVKEIATMCEIDISVLNKAVKIFDQYMKEDTETCKTTSAVDLAHRQLNTLSIERQSKFHIVKEIRTMHDKLDEIGILHGKTPIAVSASLIYVAMKTLNMNPEIKIISEKTEVSVVTLNKIIGIITKVCSN